MANILVLGATGYIGRNLCRALRSDELHHRGVGRRDGDLLAELPDLSAYDTVINCAGAADMDRAEDEHAYRCSMYELNATIPGLLRWGFAGYFVHISTPFAFWPDFSHYARSKWVADCQLRRMPGSTAIIYPGWLYGGDGSRQLDAILRSLRGKAAIIDNTRIGDLTNVAAFCQGLIGLIVVQHIGAAAIYEPHATTAYSAARDWGIWDANWCPGVYCDSAKRPANSSHDVLPDSIIRCEVRHGAAIQQL